MSRHTFFIDSTPVAGEFVELSRDQKHHLFKVFRAVPGDEIDPELMKDCKTVLGKDADRIDYIERFAFYDRARQAFAVVVSGESRIYGNIIVKKGVTKP